MSEAGPARFPERPVPVRLPPTVPPEQSYAQQTVTVQLDRVRWRIEPAEHAPTGEAPHLAEPLHLISAWHPGGRESTLGQCLRAQQRLRGELCDAGLEVQYGALVPTDYRWHEGVLLVAGLDDRQAVRWATAYEQAAVVRWDAEALTVLPTGLVCPVPASRSGWTAVRLETRPCPMGPPRPREARCTHLAGVLSGRQRAHYRHREVAVEVLGCTTCSAGPGSYRGMADLPNSPVHRVGGGVASRYGGATWH